MELVIFVTFVAIQYGAKALPVWLEKQIGDHDSEAGKRINRLAGKHFAVWIVHPAVLHGLHDYTIHLIVYSGYVIRAH